MNKVKQLDDKPSPPLIDHIGWRLWRAGEQWQRRFRRDMVAAGHAAFEEARYALLPHIDREGVRQNELAQRCGLSKQAVQQLVDGLEADGIVERQVDPDDARARRVSFTAQGLALLADANAVKLRIAREYRKRLGAAAFAQLEAALEALSDDAAA